MTNEAALRRDTPLARIIKDRIGAEGPMPIATYMSYCLWDAQHGYYATKQAIGRAGDFITASEISQIFGELIGLWAGVVWREAFSAPHRVTFAEYGPGRGALMRDAIRSGRVVPGFIGAAHVHLVEMSPVLKAIQQTTLQDCGAPVAWSQNLAGFQAPAIIVANEFLDAWPVTQWIKTADGWRLRAVGADAAGDLEFTALQGGPLNAELDADYAAAPVGAIYESLDVTRFAGALSAIGKSGPIAALVIDYGYTTPGAGDTLQALRNHAIEHPLASPGEADLSTHVNFHALAVALHRAGLAIDGPVTQAEFLGQLGIVERASRLMSANPQRAGEIEAGVARLLAPTGMGARFKVVGVRRADVPPLPGFAAAAAG
ncbi:MAG: class I SAM-dependent methyltransferase [Hyphomicrobium sp.]